MPRALVIGAGFGGIAASLRLKAKGYDVGIIDQCPEIGGRAQVYEVDGFRHDAGPTVITAPFIFEELFSLFNKSLSDYISLVPLSPWYRFVFNDGSEFNYGGTVEDTLKEISKFNKDDVDGYKKLVEHSRKIFEVGFEELSDKPFHNINSMLATIPKLVSLQSYKTVWQLVSTYISDPKLRQAFAIQPLLVGGNPFDTTSIYSLIHYLERKWGVHFVMGGTGALVESFKKLMTEEGIKIRNNCKIEELVTENKKIVAVKTNGGENLKADIFVSNCDPTYFYKDMSSGSKLNIQTKTKLKTAKYSMGLFVLYFGTTKKYENIAHHTIWLGKRFKSLLNDIFQKKHLAEDFSLYLHRPTATDPSFAPEGCDSFYVLAPVPNLQAEIDWNVEGPKLKDRIIESLDKTILPNLKQNIVADFFKTPEDFKNDYSTTFGTGFTIAPIFTQSAWFRFHNKSESFRNLYLVGAGTHPGAGLPGVVSSAKVLDNLIQKVA